MIGRSLKIPYLDFRRHLSPEFLQRNVQDLTLMHDPWLLMFVILMVGVIANARRANKYSHLLQTRFPNAWKDIECTKIIGGEMQTQRNLLGFIVRRKYLLLNDEEIIGGGENLRRYVIAYSVVCAIFFLLTATLLIFG